MRKIILRLRKKKEEERRVILHILTFIFMIILIFAWIYSLSARLSQKDENSKTIESDVKPFVNLGNELGEDFNGLKN